MQEPPETVKPGTPKRGDPSALASEEYRALLRRAQQCRRVDAEEVPGEEPEHRSNVVGVSVEQLHEAERRFEASQRHRMRWDLVVMVGLVLAVLVVGVKFYLTYHGMRHTLTTVEQTKGNLFLVLDRRRRLAEQLVALNSQDTAEAAAARDHLKVAEQAIRTGDPASQAQGLDTVNTVLHQVIRASERSESVRSSAIYKTLRKQVWESDALLATYRKVYNSSVKRYNQDAEHITAGLCQRAFRWPGRLVYFRVGG